MAKEILLDIKVDAKGAQQSVKDLGGAVDTLSNKVDKASENTNKSVKAFVKLKDGIKALAGATIVLKAFDIAAETFQSLDVVARKVEQAFALIKATLMSLVPVMDSFIKASLSLLKGEFEEAGKFSGIFISQLKKVPDAIVEMSTEALKGVDAMRALRDAERELNVETAKRQALIEENKYISEDEKRSIDERLQAAKTAYALESEIAQKRIALERERIDIIMSDPTRDPNAESTLNDLAEAKIAIEQAIVDQKSRQTELNNKINQLEKERPILDDNFRAEIRDNIQTLEDEKRTIIIDSTRLTKAQLAKIEDIERKVRILKAKEEAELLRYIALEGASTTANAIIQLNDVVNQNKLIGVEKGSIEEQRILEKQWRFNKKLQLAAAIIDGYKAVNASLSQSPISIGPVPNPAGILSLAFATTTSALNVAKIAAAKYGGSAISSSAPSIPSFSAPQNQTVNVGNFDQQNQQPIQAYVTATDVSNALEARKFLQNRNKL